MDNDGWFPFSKQSKRVAELRDIETELRYSEAELRERELTLKRERTALPSREDSLRDREREPSFSAARPRRFSEEESVLLGRGPEPIYHSASKSPSSDDRLCPACSAWKCRGDDAWCGNCGEPCARIRLMIEPAFMQIGNLMPPVKLLVYNDSYADLKIDRWNKPEWISLGNGPAVLPAGKCSTFSAIANTISLTVPEAASVVLHTDAGTAGTVVIAMEERPSVVCVPAELELWKVPNGEMPPVSVKLAPKAGSLSVRGVRPGGYAGLEVIGRLEKPVMASVGGGAAITLRAQVDRFLNQPSASLLVEFDGPHGPTEVEVPVKVAIRNPPDISWDGEHKPPPECYQSTAQRLEFVLANRSPRATDGGAANARLEIQSVTLEPPPGINIPVRLVKGVPATLRGGESATVAFEANLSEAPVRPGVSVPLKFRLRVQANGPSLDKKDVVVLVRALPVYDGVLAIDFGSTSTCCAVLETGRESELLRFDEAGASPTIVRYMDLSGPEPEVEIGGRVQRVVALDARAAASAIARLKQRLGDERKPIWVLPYKASEGTYRTATQAASDYLREVRSIVERNKTTLFDDFILTHPAVCSLLQYRNLTRALMWGFGVKAGHPPRFLQEPIAALVPFMAKKARERDTNFYTVASFDLGGGTTDIAALRVEHRLLSGGRVEVRPEIRYSRGVRFGGDDLTDFLVAEFEKRLGRLISQSEPGAILVKEGAPGASPEAIAANRFILRQVADAFKVRLSELSTNQDPQLLPLQIMFPGGMAPKVFSRSFADLRAAGDTDLVDLFIDEVRNRVWKHTRLLHAAARADRAGDLEFIQVSGMTAYIPAVIETIKYEFPNSTVFRAENPKECVVAGACLARAMGPGSAIRLVLPDSSRRTTSSIGTYDLSTQEFSAVIPLDTAIPDKGLTGDAQELRWYGSEKIPIWENLGADDDEIRETGTAGLSKLGTWVPARREPAAEDEGWTLRFLLKDFQLTVTAVGPAGEVVPFTRRHEPDEEGTDEA